MFNPFKNRNINQEELNPVFTDNSSIQKNDDGINYIEEESTINIKYEGVSVADLQESGINTISLLKFASKNIDSNKETFNIPLLESIWLPFIIEYLGGVKNEKKSNSYLIFNQEISLKAEEHKWYNVTKKRGSKHAISLMKHLISIKNNVDEFEEKNTLFKLACRELTNIHNYLLELENKSISSPKNNEIATKTVNKETKESETKNEVVTNQTNTNQTKTKIDYKARDEALNSIPLNILFESLGANENEDGQAGKWKMHDLSDNIALTGNKWFSWNSREGGTGAISYMKFHISRLNNLNLLDNQDNKNAYLLAVNELIKLFGSELGNFEPSDTSQVVLKQPFAMPHIIDFKINQVRTYLHEKRGIPLWIINKQINAGLLFAGYPSDWPSQPKGLFNPNKCKDEDIWATFLSINGEGAEMRAIKRSDNFAKIKASGSDTELGGFLIKAEKKYSEKIVTALEAAVDSCSFHAIYPGRIATSCMGVNFNLAVKLALETFDRESYKFELAFDNDLAGNEATVRFKNELINSIGEEEYAKLIKDDRILYFNLGKKCLLESIENDQIYYFDVVNNDEGKEAVKMFQESLIKDIGSDKVKELINKGKIKYINLSPNFNIMQNPQKEAENVFQLLSSGKPFYLRFKENDEDIKDKALEKKNEFINHLRNISIDKFKEFEESGKIIYHKDSLAKDWNEYLIHKQKNPEFKQYLNSIESELSNNYGKSNSKPK